MRPHLRCKGKDILGFVGRVRKYEPRLVESTPIDGSIARTVNHCEGDMFWYPMKSEIQDWVDYKAREFA